MTVIGTVNEINTVLRYFNLKFPRQNLESLQRNECFYVLNGIPVEIILTKEQNNKDINKD